MKRAAAIIALLLAGCGEMPQTAEGFRKAAPDAFMGKTETIEVSRAYRDVSATFQRKAPECLNVTVTTTERSSTGGNTVVAAYKPTVLVTKERTELHVQVEYKKGVVNVHKVPEGGYYRVVADAYPLPGNRTRLQWFGPSRGEDVLIRAIKSWASGENLGCPDFTNR